MEANTAYWDQARFPRLKRLIFDNTLSQKEAMELVKAGEGRVDLVTGLSPLETLRVAQSPFARVVKNRGSLETVFGLFNVRKAGGPWRDVRLRQAVNLAVNREDFLRYASKGNGVISPALLPPWSMGYDPTLASFAFAPDTARDLLRVAGYPEGLSVRLIAPDTLEVQATVVSKMLEQIGLRVDLQILDATAAHRQINLDVSDPPPEARAWDIALTGWIDFLHFPLYHAYYNHALDGPRDWVDEEPQLRQLYQQVLGTVDRADQQALIRQMERHTHEHAYFLFLYSPIGLYAVNKAVQFVPYVTGFLRLGETSVTEEHWSVRKK